MRTYREWIDYFCALGCCKDDATKLADKIKLGNYDVIELSNEDTFLIGDGAQHFGSGGYYHGFRIWVPKDADLEEIAEIIDKKTYHDSFIDGIWYILKPRSNKPFIISHGRGDGIGEGRVFAREIFIFKG